MAGTLDKNCRILWVLLEAEANPLLKEMSGYQSEYLLDALGYFPRHFLDR